MIDLLPLERNAVLSEINKELALAGSAFIVSRGLVVDMAESAYGLMTYINAKFSAVDVPFCTVFDKICDFVQGFADHYDKLRADNKAWHK